MNCTFQLLHGRAENLLATLSEQVDLIVTSPPYPMITMWDSSFTSVQEDIGEDLASGDGTRAFARMHAQLDQVWQNCHRVLREGGLVCVNIGDATRTIDGDFQLYSNHARIIEAFRNLGFTVLPDILWRKQTNAPNKFMGSGMLPVGAYVTYEHEYILIFRKGRRRKFTSPEEKALRRKSAFFWEERNQWFSDVWEDLKGTRQAVLTEAERKRSAAFPFELAYRLINMFSVQGDVVLDPFLGTGTTLAAAMTACRSGVGIECEKSFLSSAWHYLHTMPRSGNDLLANRLERHKNFVEERNRKGKPIKHWNDHYQFPVVTAQEKEIRFPVPSEAKEAGEGRLLVNYNELLQPEPLPTKSKIGSQPELFNTTYASFLA